MTYTRSQLEALRVKLHEMAEKARHTEREIEWENDVSVSIDHGYLRYGGRADAFAKAAEQVALLIDSGKEVTQ